MKSFISIRETGRADLLALIEAAVSYAEGRRDVNRLSERAVATLFFERSTRTRLSFELAAARLGAYVMSFDPATASTGKGESLRDTVTTVAAIGADILVVRHSEGGVPARIADWTGRAVVNAGDGVNEHPTQALVDAVTLHRHFGEARGLRMGIVGDIRHSRVANSLIGAMETMGVDVVLVGPPEFLPEGGHGPPSVTDLDEVLPSLDVVYLLRVQKERGAVVGDDYARRYGLSGGRASTLGDSAVVMHAGPLNRGIEIADEVADGPRSLILEQVSNGVPARMAVLAALEGVLA